MYLKRLNTRHTQSIMFDAHLFLVPKFVPRRERAWTFVCVPLKCLAVLYCPIVTKLQFSLQTSVKILSVKFQDQRQHGCSKRADGRTDGQTTRSFAIVAFLYTNAPKKQLKRRCCTNATAEHSKLAVLSIEQSVVVFVNNYWTSRNKHV